MPTNARRRRPFDPGGPWGTGLLLLGISAVVQGAAYTLELGANMSNPLLALGEWTPLWMWGVAWAIAGLYAIAKALRPPQHHTDVLPVVVLITVWSSAYLVYWATGVAVGNWTREWAPGVAWGFLGAYIVAMARCVNPPHGRDQ